MKKKIKDLTLKEMAKICRERKWCDICPLSICSKTLKGSKAKNVRSLESEVEVDD